MPAWDHFRAQIGALSSAAVFDPAADFAPYFDASDFRMKRLLLKESRPAEFITIPMFAAAADIASVNATLYYRALRLPFAMTLKAAVLTLDTVQSTGTNFAVDILNSTTSILDNTTTASAVLVCSNGLSIGSIAIHASHQSQAAGGLLLFYHTANAGAAGTARKPRIHLVGWRT